jgi:hypothetical protein
VGPRHRELLGVVVLVWCIRRDSRAGGRGHALRQARATPKLGHSDLSRFGSKHLFWDDEFISGHDGCDRWRSRIRHKRLSDLLPKNRRKVSMILAKLIGPLFLYHPESEFSACHPRRVNC